MGAAQRDSIITFSTMLRNGKWHESWQSLPLVSQLLCMLCSSFFVKDIIPECERNQLKLLSCKLSCKCFAKVQLISPTCFISVPIYSFVWCYLVMCWLKHNLLSCLTVCEEAVPNFSTT